MSTAALLFKLFRHKAWADDELLACVAQLDPDRQAAERHAAVRLLNHIHVVDRIFAGHLAGTPHGYTATNTPETPTLPALAAAIAQTDGWYLAHLGMLDEQALAQVLHFRFTDGSAGAMSREEMLAHVATHGGYHRGAVGRVLSQAGITPPRDLLTGHLHLTEPQRRDGSGAVQAVDVTLLASVAGSKWIRMHRCSYTFSHAATGSNTPSSRSSSSSLARRRAARVSASGRQ